MQSNEQNPDVIIIGGGLAGLAAATMLARSGRRVRLFEQSAALGGRARTKVQDGFYLNLGPHALYRSGQANKILGELGVEPRGRVPSVSGAYAVRRNVKHTFPAGLVSMLTTSLFGLSAKLEAARLLASLPKMETTRLMGVSVREWLDSHISDQVVKEFLMAVFRVSTYTNAPDLMSAGAALEQLRMAFDKSVLYLDGGWQTLVDQLGRLAADAGVISRNRGEDRLGRARRGGRCARCATGRWPQLFLFGCRHSRQPAGRRLARRTGPRDFARPLGRRAGCSSSRVP